MIAVSEENWQTITSLGSCGDTVNDVITRILSKEKVKEKT
jgi:hypothetical protein